jgi:hypothetical protein
VDEETSFQEIEADWIRADDSFQRSPGADAVVLRWRLLILFQYYHDLI